MKKKSVYIFYALAIVAVITACKPVREKTLESSTPNNAKGEARTIATKDTIRTGADQTEKYVPYLRGKRIAILANQTSIIGRRHMVDSLKSLGVNSLTNYL